MFGGCVLTINPRWFLQLFEWCPLREGGSAPRASTPSFFCSCVPGPFPEWDAWYLRVKAELGDRSLPLGADFEVRGLG